MLFGLLAKLLWGTTKFTVKHVVIPLAYTAAMAAAISWAAEQIREGSPEHNGHAEPVVKASKQA